MRVAIVGAGIVGVATAYELAAEGYEVSVFERHGSVAAQASFAPGGLIAPALVSPWSAAHGEATAAPWHLASRLDAGSWRWLRAARKHADAPPAGTQALQALARASLARLQRLTVELHIAHERTQGCLVLWRDDQDLAQARPWLKRMAEAGKRFELLDAARCRALEPGLGLETPLRAGVRLPDAEIGNVRQFAHELRSEAQRLGASFRFDTPVHSLTAGRTPTLVHGSSSDSSSESFDAIVICAALDAAPLLRPLGLKLALRGLHGYSLTAPLRHVDSHPDIGPRAGLLDHRHEVSICRLGQRVRVAGVAELGGDAERFDDAAIATLYQVLHDWFPGAAQLDRVQRWKGTRTLLPDGLPAIGRSGLEGIWLNLGHGAHGWALACGSARLIADQLASRHPAVDASAMDPARLR